MMESRPIREIAYEVLKHAIVTGKFPPVSALVETDYAERLISAALPYAKPYASWSVTAW